MKPAVIESMTRINLGMQGQFRVWRQEAEAKEVYDNTDLVTFVDNLMEKPYNFCLIRSTNPVAVMKALLAYDRVNAVEWTNPAGNGVVLYKEWP